ncbi:LRR receptor-like serine/threonine-protein kinase FLS2 [Solanum lycopersicum]|uniref:LRR receptor-like serine/threonine-protein kinase FLS2 n=1 Tax=Solanum lycopersicum TaxID=4081 RepID=UPI00374831AB
MAFKSSLRLEPHNILSTNWSSDTHYYSWYVVSCLHQRVVALQLPNLDIQGRVSSEIANLTQLALLDLSSNDLNGNLPSELGFLQKLKLLNVTGNSLDGTIPLNISRCRLLQQLHLSDNMIKGSIPQELGLLSQREIPDEIGDLTNLRLLSFRGNHFTGLVPASIFNISRLQIVDLSINALSGELPTTGSGGMHRRSLISSSLKMICKEIFQVSLVSCMNWPGLSFEYNRISGAIPSSLFNISSLQILKARHNYLNGHLPYDLGTWLPNLQEIFLSHNQFSGDLPSAICNASKLENLEVANDSFTGPIPMMLGEVPKKGVFANVSYRFLMGNPRLCGAPDLYIPLYPAEGRKTTRKKSIILRTTVPVAVTFLILVALFFTWMIWSRKKPVTGNNESDYPPRIAHQRITNYELLQATENFSQSKLVGSGSSCTVYQGTFSGGAVFAIKIVSTAIVLEYMPNGSLDKRLYSDENCLSLVERLNNIMIDVALAMEYLHHDYTVPIVHCDTIDENQSQIKGFDNKCCIPVFERVGRGKDKHERGCGAAKQDQS